MDLIMVVIRINMILIGVLFRLVSFRGLCLYRQGLCPGGLLLKLIRLVKGLCNCCMSKRWCRCRLGLLDLWLGLHKRLCDL